MKRILFKLLCVSLVLTFHLSPLTLRSQGSAFMANQQRMAVLPDEVTNVSMVDGDLHCFSAGVLLKAQRSGKQLQGFWADTVYVRLRENVEYVVKQPVTGDIYITARDKKGDSYLYCCSNIDSKNPKAKQVKMGGGWFNKGMTVEHPTFTGDGRVLIFTSEDQRSSEGGYDLWYSQFDGKRWLKPQNLGRRINTPGDEVAPVIYRDCLIFSSDGHTEDHGRLSLYSTRLISGSVEGDTIDMMQIGRCRVQRLPAPLNSDHADDCNMVFDTALDCGYWVSDRAPVDTVSQFYSFLGKLDGVLLWGKVTDKKGYPLAGVTVTARQGKEVVCNTVSDRDGSYYIYLMGNQYYELSFQRDGFFVDYESINTAKGGEEYLISEARQDAQLDQLPLDQRIFFEDIFGPDVDIELSERGAELLEPLVQFLVDNPALTVDMSLVNDLTNDKNFNMMLLKSITISNKEWSS